VVTPGRTELTRALLAALLTTVAAPSRADPGRASLVVTRDDGSRECSDSAALSRRVEVIAGKSLFSSNENEPRDTWVQVEFVRQISGFRAVISAHGSRQGTRALDDVGPDCGSLAEAVAVTLAILLDPATAQNESIQASSLAGVSVAENLFSEPPPLPSPISPPAKAPVDAPRDSPKTETERARRVFGVEAGAGAALGVLDGLALFVEGGGRARLGEVFVLGAGAGYVLPDELQFAEGSVGMSLTYGYVRACANVLPKRRVIVEACLEPMLGALRGEGRGYETNEVEWVFWSAAAALFQSYGPISDEVFWSLRARVLAPLAQRGFSVEQQNSAEPAFELSPVGVTLSAGIEAEL
jgi:hypothetical protein